MPEPTGPRVRWFRQVVVPLALVALLAGAWELPEVWRWADLDTGPLGTLGLVRLLAVLVFVILFAVWFLIFSGFSLRARLLGVGAALLLAGAAVACVGEVGVEGSVTPFVKRWRWEPRPADLLRQELRERADDSGLSAVDLAVGENDFPRYRGERADGVVRGVRLATDWGERPPKERWRHRVGGGFAGFAVAGNVAVTVEQRDEDEVVVCYDRATGRQRWAYAYPAHFRDPTGDGPRATPTIAGGDVYSLGATGVLVCLDGKSGKLRWKADVLKDNGAKRVRWGMSGSPLVAGGKVIVNAGVDPERNVGRSLAAYDRETGKVVWAKGEHEAGYSSPQLATLAGREQVLLFDGGGLAGFDLKTGEELWRYPWKTYQEMNIVQPVVVGEDRVFIASEASNGCCLVRVRGEGKKFVAEPVWSNRNLCAKFSNPVAGGGFLYGLNYGNRLVCLDAETGERRWASGRQWYGHGQLLRAGGVLLVSTDRGDVALVGAGPERFRELGRVKVFNEQTWNTPALAGNELFVRNDVWMACYELPAGE
jgi:outer membrane protein assembly factor BamB